MGIDVGTSYTKGVIIDKYNNIMSSCHMETLGDPVGTSKRVILKMKDDIDLSKYKIVSVGVCGFAKRLVGVLLNSQIIKNEVTAVTTSVLSVYPNAKTIIDIGGEDSKIILINDSKVVDYVMNTACGSGIGNFISDLSKKMNIPMSSFSSLKDNGNLNITSRCMIYVESALIKKIMDGYSKNDILFAACKMVSQNYVNGVCKGKKINEPIVFVGGVSKNNTIVRCLEKELGKKIIVNKNSHLFGCIGMAMMARDSKKEREFNFDIENNNIETKISSCMNCDNRCGIVTVYKNNKIIDIWGNKCDKIKMCKE